MYPERALEKISTPFHDKKSLQTRNRRDCFQANNRAINESTTYLFETENETERESMRWGRIRGRSRLPAEQGA